MDNDEWQQLTGENMTDETRKDYEEEKLKETYVPVHPANQTIDECLEYMTEEAKGLAPSVEEVAYEFIKLQIADLKPKEKIDLAIYCFKEASKELKK